MYGLLLGSSLRISQVIVIRHDRVIVCTNGSMGGQIKVGHISVPKAQIFHSFDPISRIQELNPFTGTQFT